MYMRKMPHQERNGMKIPNDRWLDYFLARDMEQIQMDLEEYLKNMDKWGEQIKTYGQRLKMSKQIREKCKNKSEEIHLTADEGSWLHNHLMANIPYTFYNLAETSDDETMQNVYLSNFYGIHKYLKIMDPDYHLRL